MAQETKKQGKYSVLTETLQREIAKLSSDKLYSSVDKFVAKSSDSKLSTFSIWHGQFGTNKSNCAGFRGFLQPCWIEFMVQTFNETLPHKVPTG